MINLLIGLICLICIVNTHMLLVPMRVKGVMGAGEKVYFEKVLCVNMEDEIQIVAVPEPGV